MVNTSRRGEENDQADIFNIIVQKRTNTRHYNNLRKAVKMAGKESSQGSQGYRAELLLGLRPKTRNTRSRRRPGRLVQASKDDEPGREVRPQLGVRQRRGWRTPEGRELIRERRIRWFHTLLNAKSPKLDPSIAERLDQWPENMPLGVQPTVQELTGVIRLLANGKAVGLDGVSVELFKITLNGDPALRRGLLDIVVVCIWRGERRAAAVEICHHHGTP